ncbi:MAG TPA: keywimysin-related RiPP [Micromonosporaceae bacterium]|jgi:hypothetical protein|nr:keywimysin-related RiPP [Micromonosporaceae bacterium]
MRTYERPTLTRVGTFREVTGQLIRGPKDLLDHGNIL